MDRRHFLKVTGLVAVTAALGAVSVSPAAAATLDTVPTEAVRNLVGIPRLTVTQLAMREAGEYKVTARIRLESPTVEIGGVANSKQITWGGDAAQVVSFTSFESYDGRSLAPAISVRGGTLESLSVTPVSSSE